MIDTFDFRQLCSRTLAAANHSPRIVLLLTCAVLVAPALVTGCVALENSLGVNPLEVLVRDSGHWALVWLLAALTLPPLRHALLAAATWRGWRCGWHLSDWNWLMRMRRPVGLASFFYAVAHLALYVVLDLDFSWDELLGDLRDKLYIDAGIASFVLLTPLAITSSDNWVKRLRRNWKRLHTLIYPASILALAHFVLLSKPGVADPYGYGAALAALLLYRIVDHRLRGGTIPAQGVEDVVSGRSAAVNRVQEIGPHR